MRPPTRGLQQRSGSAWLLRPLRLQRQRQLLQRGPRAGSSGAHRGHGSTKGPRCARCAQYSTGTSNAAVLLGRAPLITTTCFGCLLTTGRAHWPRTPQAELSFAAAPPPRPPAMLVFERPLRDIRARAAAGAAQLVDSVAQELWSAAPGGEATAALEGLAGEASTTGRAADARAGMVRRVRREAGAQAAPRIIDRAVQVGRG
jgi:hypothetical protein